MKNEELYNFFNIASSNLTPAEYYQAYVMSYTKMCLKRNKRNKADIIIEIANKFRNESTKALNSAILPIFTKEELLNILNFSQRTIKKLCDEYNEK